MKTDPDLEMARRHIRDGRRLVMEQLRRVQRRPAVERSESLLWAFRSILAGFERHLASMEGERQPKGKKPR
jgi:hypothetical protein